MRSASPFAGSFAYHRIVRLRVLLPLAFVPALVLAVPARTSSVAPVEEWTERFAALVEARNGVALDARAARRSARSGPTSTSASPSRTCTGRARLLSGDYAGASPPGRRCRRPAIRCATSRCTTRRARPRGSVPRTRRRACARSSSSARAAAPTWRTRSPSTRPRCVAARDAGALAVVRGAARTAGDAVASRRRLDADLCGLLMDGGEVARAVAVGQRAAARERGRRRGRPRGARARRAGGARAADARTSASAWASPRASTAASTARWRSCSRGAGRAAGARDDLLFSIGRAHFVAEDYAAGRAHVRAGRRPPRTPRRGRASCTTPRARPSCAGDDKAVGGAARCARWRAAPRPPARTARGRAGPVAPRPPTRRAACLARLQLVRLYASQKRFAAAEPAPGRAPRRPLSGRAGEADRRVRVGRDRGRPRRLGPRRARRVAAGASREAEGEYWSARALETIDPAAGGGRAPRAAAPGDGLAVRALRGGAAGRPARAGRAARARGTPAAGGRGRTRSRRPRRGPAAARPTPCCWRRPRPRRDGARATA